jgi:hypothetical protein
VVCEIDVWRGYVYGEFVAVQDREWVIARSGGFRWPRREGVPPQSRAAERRLAELCERLSVLGWEYEGVTRKGAWYAVSFSCPYHSVRLPLPAASQPLAQAVASVGPGLPEPESVYAGVARLDGPQPHESPGPDVLSLVQPEQPTTGVEPREDGRQALAATADAGLILAQAIRPSAEVDGLPQDAGGPGALTADARPVLPPAEQIPAIVGEPAQDVDHLPASPVAAAVPLLTRLEQASALPEGRPLANAGEGDQARRSLAPAQLKRLRRAYRRTRTSSASDAVADEVARADEQAPVELEPAFAGPDPGQSEPTSPTPRSRRWPGRVRRA